MTSSRLLLGLLLLALAQLLACAPEDLPLSEEERESSALPAGLGGPLDFQAATLSGTRLSIAAVGDVLLHKGLQVQAFADEDRFRSLWLQAERDLRKADLAYANLEGPAARGVDIYGHDRPDPSPPRYDGVIYTEYPQFNYHPSLIDDLKLAGIDVVSTANNHSLDHRTLGVDRTVDALMSAALSFSGTRRAGSDRPWHTIIRRKGITLAWIACTDDVGGPGTNTIPDRDQQVLFCSAVEPLLRDLAAQQGVDGVIVAPHWGLEYQPLPRQRQRDLAKAWAEAGALAILGSHPHVLEPWEKVVTQDGREVFVHYSLGNFVSGQKGIDRQLTMICSLDLVLHAAVNEPRPLPPDADHVPDGAALASTVAGKRRLLIRGVSYLPLQMKSDPWSLEALRCDGTGSAVLRQSCERFTKVFGARDLRLPAPEPSSAGGSI